MLFSIPYNHCTLLVYCVLIGRCREWARLDPMVPVGCRTRWDYCLWRQRAAENTKIQWNLSVTTTSITTFITFYLSSNVFWWKLKVPIYSCYQFLPSGAHLCGLWPLGLAPEGREVSHQMVVIERFRCIYRNKVFSIKYAHVCFDSFWHGCIIIISSTKGGMNLLLHSQTSTTVQPLRFGLLIPQFTEYVITYPCWG